MNDKRQAIPVIGLFATIAVAVYMVVQLNGQERIPAGDFTSATTAEVRNPQGQIVLRGQFARTDEDDDDIERKATLESTGVDADAAGDAEVEFARAAPARQEIEFSVRNLQPGAAFTFLIDGIDVTTAAADTAGRIEVDVDVPTPGTTGSR